MSNQYRFCIRFMSNDDLSEFTELYQQSDCKYVKKGDKVRNNSKRIALNNIFLIKDFFVTESIEKDTDNIMQSLISIVEKIDNKKIMHKELYIVGTIEEQQFGFNLNTKFIELLTQYNFSFSFSGVVYSVD